MHNITRIFIYKYSLLLNLMFVFNPMLVNMISALYILIIDVSAVMLTLIGSSCLLMRF